jgi:structure-specific endonuclease subunit SLX1
MLGLTPWSTWPLHVKIFTSEAAKAWEAAEKTLPVFTLLPPGFTCSIELEGVDGKKASANVGSGRMGPIDTSDGKTIYCVSFTVSTPF